MENEINSSIKYTGTVKVICKNENKTIFTRTYHNNGNTYLWEFLAKCAGGSYVADLLPCYIKVFDTTQSYSSANPPAITTDSSTPLSNYINKTTTTWHKSSGSIDGVILHFIIPTAFIFSTSGAKIKQLGLYSAKAKDTGVVTNYSAMFNLVNNAKTDWEYIEIPENSNYNIFIEWTMTFSN